MSNLVKLGLVVSEICEQTENQKYSLLYMYIVLLLWAKYM